MMFAWGITDGKYLFRNPEFPPASLSHFHRQYFFAVLHFVFARGGYLKNLRNTVAHEPYFDNFYLMRCGKYKYVWTYILGVTRNLI
jgi:hypothetical protein